MSGWARQGVECVCIRDTPWIGVSTLAVVPGGPVKNEYLVIYRVVSHPEHGVGLGFDNHREADGRLSIFPIQFFRPIVEQKDDVAIFAHHLDVVGEPA